MLNSLVRRALTVNMVASDKEKWLFKRLQSIRYLFGTPSSSSHNPDSLFIRNIIHNRLASLGIDASPGELDALADDIEHYIDTTFDHFVTFFKERRSQGGSA